MSSTSNFFKVISNHTIIFQLAGLQFFTLNAEDNQKFLRKHKFNLGAVLMIFSCFLVGISYAIVEEPLSHGDKVLSKANSTFAYTFTIFSVVGLMVFSMLFAYAMTRKSMKILTNFDEVSRIFTNNLNSPIEYETFSRKYRRVSILVFVIASIVTAVYLIALASSKTKAQWILYSIFFVIVNLFFEIVFFRFIFLTMLVNHNLKNLEAVIDKIQKNMNAIVVTTKSFGIGHIRNDDHFEIAMTLKKIYGLIFVSSKLINEVCGPFNTISVGFAVVSLLSDSSSSS
jgi:hypothetical protein